MYDGVEDGFPERFGYCDALQRHVVLLQRVSDGETSVVRAALDRKRSAQDHLAERTDVGFGDENCKEEVIQYGISKATKKENII